MGDHTYSIILSTNALCMLSCFLPILADVEIRHEHRSEPDFQHLIEDSINLRSQLKVLKTFEIMTR